MHNSLLGALKELIPPAAKLLDARFLHVVVVAADARLDNVCIVQAHLGLDLARLQQLARRHKVQRRRIKRPLEAAQPVWLLLVADVLQCLAEPKLDQRAAQLHQNLAERLRGHEAQQRALFQRLGLGLNMLGRVELLRDEEMVRLVPDLDVVVFPWPAALAWLPIRLSQDTTLLPAPGIVNPWRCTQLENGQTYLECYLQSLFGAQRWAACLDQVYWP